MRRRPFRCALLLTVGLLLGLSSARAEEGSADRPNVVLIVADDLGWADLGCYGSTFYETPALDRLATEGVRFTDAYAAAPVCSPSRAALMTGKNPARLGITAHIGDAQPEHWKRDTPLKPAGYVNRLPLEETTLAEQLHDAGYATLHAGKWHLGHERHYPEYQGFDVNIGGWSQGGPFTGNGYFSPHGNPRLADGPPGEYLTDRLAEEASRFVQAHRHEPFFVHLAFYSVHVPLQARADLLEKYERKLATLPEIDCSLVEGVDSPERARQDLPVYAAMVETLDQAVGRVLESLDRAGVADETIVIFTSDNGGLATGDLGISPAEGWPTTNRPLRAGKGWLYEGGLRVPLIVRTAGGDRTASVSDRVVAGSDLYTTVLDLIGLPSNQADTDSESFSEALIKRDAKARSPAFWHYPHYGNQGGRPGGAVRADQWKLIEWYGSEADDSEVELYDLASDQAEQHDLAATQPEKARELLERLRRWREELAVSMPTPNDSAVPAQNTKPRSARLASEREPL